MMIRVSSSGVKSYTVTAVMLGIIEAKAKSQNKQFEYVAVYNSEADAWDVYPTEIDPDITERLQSSGIVLHLSQARSLARSQDMAENKKSFLERHPYMPIAIAIGALIGSIIAPLLR